MTFGNRNMNHQLFSLDQLEVVSPCDVGWENMSGDDRVRFCHECRLSVYNIAAMTRAEAEGLVRHHEGRLCVSLVRRSDGTVMTRDCRLGLRVRRGIGRAIWAAGLVVAAIVGGLACLARRDPEAARQTTLEPFKTAATNVSPCAPPP